MTILNFVLSKDVVCLVTDTMASDPADMEPFCFTTKVYPAPHWQGLICGTGIMQFIVEWYRTAITSLVARDIKHLDKFAPAVLRELFPQFQKNEGHGFTSTIYHLGFDQTEGRFIGFAYRSTDDFVSEQLEYGTRLKPDPEDDSLKVEKFPEDFISLAEAQKVKDEMKPVDQRVGIGGQLISYTMQRVDVGVGEHQVLTTINRCHEFADFASAYSRACAKLPAKH